MNLKAWLLAFLLGATALAPVFWVAYHYGSGVTVPHENVIASVQFQQQYQKELAVGSQLEVRAVKVIDGYRYEMFLSNGQAITAHLTHATSDEAIPYVVELFNKAAPPAPVVTLRRKVGNYWLVDLQLTVDEKRVSMIHVLKEKGLLL